VSALVRAIELEVLAVQAVRGAPWLEAEEVDDGWPVSEDEKVVEELEDTRPFSREELEAARNASSPHRCSTLASFPAPPRSR
jgi:hypothetical protein